MLDILRDLAALKADGKLFDYRVETDSEGNVDIYARPVTPVQYIRLDFDINMHGIKFKETNVKRSN